jgi:hypothetical protein
MADIVNSACATRSQRFASRTLGILIEKVIAPKVLK